MFTFILTPHNYALCTRSTGWVRNQPAHAQANTPLEIMMSAFRKWLATKTSENFHFPINNNMTSGAAYSSANGWIRGTGHAQVRREPVEFCDRINMDEAHCVYVTHPVECLLMLVSSKNAASWSCAATATANAAAVFVIVITANWAAAMAFWHAWSTVAHLISVASAHCIHT